jgi:hypothetical protein
LFLPKTWGLGIEWRFSLHLHPYPHLQPQRKLGNKLLAIFFLKCILNLNAYPWKKRMPKPNHYHPKYGGWRFGQENPFVRSLAPPLVCICICQGKIIRGFPNFFGGECFHLQYLPMKNKNIKGRSILLVIMWTLDPRPPRKNGKIYLQFCFARQSWLEDPFYKEKS